MRTHRSDNNLRRWEDEGGAPIVPRRSRTKHGSLHNQPALYYFNIRAENAALESDPEGLTLPDLATAFQEGLAIARQSLAQGTQTGEDRRGWGVEVKDRADQPVMTVKFSDATIALHSPRSPEKRSTEPMEQRISVITLGVRSLAASLAFYEKLGWTRSLRSVEEVVFFQVGGLVLSLFPRDDLAAEAHVPPKWAGFGGIVLGYHTRSRAEVEEVIASAERAGARILKKAQNSVWGGYSGTFSDPDGYPWEVAWNPAFSLADDGSVSLPRSE
jgi:uncharacterized protein